MNLFKRRRSGKEPLTVEPCVDEEPEEVKSATSQTPPHSGTSAYSDYDYGDVGFYSDEDAEAEGLYALDDDDAYDDGVGHPVYECMQRADIQERQKSALQQVQEVLHISPHEGRTLLSTTDWDAGKLIAAWLEDPARVCKAAGVTYPLVPAPASSSEAAAEDERGEGVRVGVAGECQICFDEAPECTALSCGHVFCNECWGVYLDMALKENKKALKCPGFKCSLTLSAAMVRKLLKSDCAASQERFETNLVNDFVERHAHARWCPAPDCDVAVFLHDGAPWKGEPVVCSCGHEFCFGCGEEPHVPATCAMMEEWSDMNGGKLEALNDALIKTTTRKCPKCKAHVEKNGGCNHVHCRCGADWCWVCDNEWTSYDSHQCGNYHKDDDEVRRARDDLKRFQFYSERFNNHHHSLALEAERRKALPESMRVLKEERHFAARDALFLSDASDVLEEARRTLLYSYAFGFFRPLKCPEVNKEIFEFLQHNLEGNTEKLAGLLQREVMCIVQADVETAAKRARQARSALLDAAANEWSGTE